jgi:hypothetical protein
MAKKANNGSTEPRSLTPDELIELQHLHRLTGARRFEAEQVKLNTLLVPRGQEVAKELEALANIWENFKNNWIAQKLTDCGYAQGQQVSIDLKTGEITPV